MELAIELAEGENNILYADNGPVETANDFSGGTFTLTTDDLMPEVLMAILGIQEEEITSEEITTTTPKWYVWNDEQATPYMGFGAVVKVQNNNTVKWQAIVLPKIKFNNPGDTFTTRGETIEWGTPEIGGTILRSDTQKHPWKMVSTPMDSEEDAEAAIKAFLQVTA